MLDWVVLALALAYLALLFLIAWAGDRRTRPPGRAPAVYALAIGVYCTSWTLYGAVGVAAEGGLDYLAIYVGPILVHGPRLAADRAHGPHRPRRERRLDLRLHLRALRQEPRASRCSSPSPRRSACCPISRCS